MGFQPSSPFGYGDHYPVTTAGQLIASIVIICRLVYWYRLQFLDTSLITEPTDLRINNWKTKSVNWTKIRQQQQILERLGI
ncbi:hypothetical protein OK016_11620 [Vibrio chagasii]|nr:hypothetical protein [Vibrio chagasii]